MLEKLGKLPKSRISIVILGPTALEQLFGKEIYCALVSKEMLQSYLKNAEQTWKKKLNNLE